MGKQKTHKGFAKRVKVTGTGKVIRSQAFRSHLMSGKSGKRRRQLRRKIRMSGAIAANARKAVGGR